MFFGTYTPKLDEKGRLFLPAKFRDQLKEGLVVTRGQERCLTVWSMADFSTLTDRLREAPIEQVIITDSIPLPPQKQLPNIRVLSVDFLMANAIKRIHNNESVSKLFE